MFDVTNNSSQDITHLLDIVQEFIPYSQQQMGWRKPVSLFFQSDEDNANKILGKTAFYSPEELSITVFVDGRHPKDVLRSLSHELVHHNQNCRGDFTNSGATGEGYAQKDPHMRNMELEAYEKGNIIFRDFEDLIKAGKINVNLSGEPKMSLKEWKNNEVNRLLMEKWGLAEKKYGSLNEEEQIFAPNHYCAHHVRENRTGQEGTCVDHNWNERLQEVTQYDVQFDNGDIRTLHVEELTVLEASLAEGHPGHVARKEDDSKEHNDEEGNRPSFAKDMGLKEAAAAGLKGQVRSKGDEHYQFDKKEREAELEEGWVQDALSGGTTKRAGGKHSPAPGRVTDTSRFKRKGQTGSGNRQIKAASELEPTQEALTIDEAKSLATRIFNILQESKSENRDEMRELAARILAKEGKE